MNRSMLSWFASRSLQRCLRLFTLVGVLLGMLLPAVPGAHAQTATGGSVVAWGWNYNGQMKVPTAPGDVTAISAGRYFSLALKRDGTVVAWGTNDVGQTNIPTGLTNVAAISASTARYHSLALKRDGTVVAWGDNSYGQVNVLAGLTNVTAIAAGEKHSLALKGDGTVVGWGTSTEDQLNIPGNLTDVVAIGAGRWHSLALKRDGTVVAWGMNVMGTVNVPAGLMNVIAISAGSHHNLALKADGTVVAWGWNDDGEANVPAGLTGVTAIAGGFEHSLALTSDVTAPETTITAQPNALTTNTNATFSFASSEMSSTFMCSLDGATFAACTSPTAYNGLAEGSHTFQVRASDLSGNVDASPASVTWTINTIVPDTTLVSAPSNPNLARTSTFTFSGSDKLGVTGFQCSLDGSSFYACSSPQSYSGLYPRSHTFQVRAVNTVGNVDPSPASVSWVQQYDIIAPAAAPSQSPAANSAGWNNGNVTVNWNWSDNAGGIGLDPSACPSSSSVTSADSNTVGQYFLQTTCADLNGNQANATYSVKIDTSAPTISAQANTPNATGWYNTPVNVFFTCDDMISGIAYNTCPAMQTLSTEGTATTSTAQTVRDMAGNVSAPSNVITAKIDTTAPATTGSASTMISQATVTLTATDSLSGIASTYYYVNGNTYAYTAPFVLTGAGTYQISYGSIDKAGNREVQKTLKVTVAGPNMFSPSVQVINAPPSVVENTLESDQFIQLFAERQNYTLSADLTLDAQGAPGTVIPAGTRVNVYYVHADQIGSQLSQIKRLSGTLTFGPKILAVLTNSTVLRNTHSRLGAAGTAYSSRDDQGLESNDIASVNPSLNSVNVAFTLGNTADDIRIITAVP